jgi:hypothetical protein
MSTGTRFQKLNEVVRELQRGDTPHRAAAAALISMSEQWSELLTDIDDGNLPAGAIPPENLLFMYDVLVKVLTEQRSLVEQELKSALATEPTTTS